MKKKRSKLISMLLTLVMTLSLVPAMGVTASAADGFVEVSTYEQLKTAVDKGDAKVKLVANIDTTNDNGGAGVTNQTALVFIGNNNILDLNGHTLKLVSNTGTTFINVNKNLTIKDSSGTRGRIDFGYGPGIVTKTTAINVADASTANLTVESGTLSSTKGGITLIESEGNLTINGGKFYAPYKEGSGGTYAIHTIHQYNDNAKTIINGGEINGVVFIQRDDSAATGTPNYGDIPVQIKGGTFKQAVLFRWTEKGKPSGDPTEFSPAVEIAGGIFEKRVNGLTGIWGEDLSTKLTGGTFKDFPNRFGLGRGGKSDHEYYSKSLGNSIIVRGNEIRTSCGWSEADWFKVYFDCFYLSSTGSESTPVTVIPNAWGMKSVTLDGNEINYAKDWKGTVERMDNSTAHTLKFEWYPLASELVNAGYTYRTTCEHYISGSTAVQQTDTIAADKTSHTITIPANADPKVYSYDLQLNLLDKNGSSVGIFSNQHIVKLVVSEAPPEPPAPVAHSITIINGFGTAEAETAMPGETVTVTADDRTAENMMFTQWYTYTAGVTFEDATKQEATFVMPDCDVKVNPGYHEVSFTNQPTDSWLSSVDDSKVYFAFSQPITSWKLVNEDDTTLASGDAESANALVAATLGPKSNKTEMTCRVIVTSNGQNFTSNEFTLKWYDVPGAPDVTVYPEGGKFVETLDVNLKTPNTYWGILYTTDGSDPYDKSGETWTKNPSAIEEYDSTRVTISNDTTIKACLYNPEGYSDMEKFGDIVTCDFTKVELTPPVADPPSGTSFYDRLNVSLSTDIVNAKIMWSGEDLDVDALDRPGMWKEYEPEKESITLSGSYGMHGFYALTGIRMEHDEGYTYWVHSDKQDYSYPRITYATIADASVTGKVNEEITPVDVSITLSGDVFAEDLTAGTDVSGWFTNLPIGLKATVKEKTNYTKTLVVTISGTTTETSTAAISVKMPKSALRYTGTSDAVEQTVLSNPKAVYNIGTSEVHTTHDTDLQAWAPLNDSQHFRSCTKGDDTQFEDHKFDTWEDKSNGTHKATCSECGYEKTENHSWKFVKEDAPTFTDAGTRYYNCSANGCTATKTESIPKLTAISVVNVTVTAPVKDAVPGTATTTDTTYSVADTDWESTVSGTFAGGTKYTVKVSLEARDNNRFTNATTFQINGQTVKPVDTIPATGLDNTVITLTFPATEGGSTSGGSSSGGGGGGVTKYAVAVSPADNGKVTPDKTSAAKGSVVTITAMANDGYALDTIKATDKAGKEIKLTDKGDGKYTFTMPASKVEVKAAFKQTASKPDKPAEEMKTVVVMQVGSKTMFVNGKAYEKDAAPVIMNDRTLVPIRFVTESLGGTVAWNAETKEVTLVIDGKEIKMTIGKTIEKYGVAPVIIDSRTFVPVRFVADELGATTAWNAETKTVTITKAVTPVKTEK